MPARAKKRKANLRRQRRVEAKKKPFIWIIVVAIFFFLLMVFINFLPSIWTKEYKMAVVTEAKGDIIILIFDPKEVGITKIVVPGETQIKSARQLGEWKAFSLWKLGYEEKVYGEYLKESLTNHLLLPTNAWLGGNLDAYYSGNLLQMTKATMFPQKTNLTLKDRLRMLSFSLKVGNSRKREINLANTSYLQKSKLVDGSDGYVVAGSIPQSIQALFTSHAFSESSATFAIVDKSGSGVVDQLGEVVEVVGAKVVSIEKSEVDDTDCIITSEVEGAVFLAELFNCRLDRQSPGNFDIKMTIGEAFVDRF